MIDFVSHTIVNIRCKENEYFESFTVSSTLWKTVSTLYVWYEGKNTRFDQIFSFRSFYNKRIPHFYYTMDKYKNYRVISVLPEIILVQLKIYLEPLLLFLDVPVIKFKSYCYTDLVFFFPSLLICIHQKV